MRRLVSHMTYAAFLGWRDLRHEPIASLCQVLAIAAVVAPLLVLYGLKAGVIAHLMAALQSDIRTRQVAIVNGPTLSGDWIAHLRQDPLIGFVQAHTRSLAAEVTIVSDTGGQQRFDDASLLASGPGDPLLPAESPPPDPTQIVLSAALATRLVVSPGQSVEVMVTRSSAERGQEVIWVPMRVIGVLAPRDWEGSGALVHLDTLIDLERWRDGSRVPARGWTTGADRGPRPDVFPNLRLYAASLDAVGPLVERLVQQGFEVRSQLASVEITIALNTSLNRLFLLLSLVAALGAAVAFGATLWASVTRKQSFLALIRLQGLQRQAVVGFPLAQAFALTLAGGAVAAAVGQISALVINRFLAPGFGLGEAICHVHLSHVAIALGVTLGLALLASTAATVSVARTDPSQGLIDHD